MKLSYNSKKAKDKNVVLEFIKNGGKCFYQYGFTFKGASPRQITTEKALELFPKYSFGMGFWEFNWCRTEDREDVILFNEYSENDLY